MAKLYSVALSKLIEDLKLETVYMPQDPQEIMIKTVDINRPGLQLCGFYDYFDGSRIQLFGLGEFAYMEKYTPVYAIRISARNFGMVNGIKSVPLYSVFCI